mmetsp:Transcript_6323/g.20281  ORF Transcript_6323/g.20281 Transcript_6323/m.20281 type:complete len:243 (-) Transcript_6323:790-1518(-)
MRCFRAAAACSSAAFAFPAAPAERAYFANASAVLVHACASPWRSRIAASWSEDASAKEPRAAAMEAAVSVLLAAADASPNASLWRVAPAKYVAAAPGSSSETSSAAMAVQTDLVEITANLLSSTTGGAAAATPSSAALALASRNRATSVASAAFASRAGVSARPPNCESSAKASGVAPSSKSRRAVRRPASIARGGTSASSAGAAFAAAASPSGRRLQARASAPRRAKRPSPAAAAFGAPRS